MATIEFLSVEILNVNWHSIHVATLAPSVVHSIGKSMMAAPDEPLVDDLVLGLWAVISLLGAARQCQDLPAMPGLVAKAEQILSAIIPHLARLASVGSTASVPATLR